MMLVRELVRRTFVAFEFRTDFATACWNREQYPEDYKDMEKPLQPGVFDRISEQYEAVMVANRTLATLKVPKGAIRFYFYDMIITTAYVEGETIDLKSNELNPSAWYYLEAEGELVTREGLKNDDGLRFHPSARRSLLSEMDEYDCDRLFEVEGDSSYPLDPDDKVIGPNEVNMVDTEIPWPSE